MRSNISGRDTTTFTKIHRPTNREVFEILRRHGKLPPMAGGSPGWPIQDNFNRANQVGLGAMSDGVHNWTDAQGQIDIVTNQAKTTGPDGGNVAVVTETHTETDYYVQAEVTSASSSDPGVFGRYTDLNNYYLLRIDNATLQLYKNVAGSFTLLGSYSTTAGTHTIKLEMNGTTLKGYLDGVEQIPSVTDTAHASGKSGIRSYYGTSPVWDNFIADLLAAAAGQPIRKRMGGIPGMRNDVPGFGSTGRW